MSIKNGRNPGACPSCGGNDLRQIIYGLPTDEILLAAGRGEVVLGGCTVFEGMPDWRCMNCGHEWFDPTDPARIEHDEWFAKRKREANDKLRSSKSSDNHCD